MSSERRASQEARSSPPAATCRPSWRSHGSTPSKLAHPIDHEGPDIEQGDRRQRSAGVGCLPAVNITRVLRLRSRPPSGQDRDADTGRTAHEAYDGLPGAACKDDAGDATAAHRSWSQASRYRTRCGWLSTHCRTATGGNTWSMRCVVRSAIRHPPPLDLARDGPEHRRRAATRAGLTPFA